MKWPGRCVSRMTASVCVCDPDQLGISDELQVAAFTCGNGAALRLEELQELLYRLPAVGRRRSVLVRFLFGEFGIDLADQVTGDPGDHLRELDGLGDVVVK